MDKNGNKPELSAHEIEIAKRMRNRGMNFRYIGRKLGVCAETVKRHIDTEWYARRRKAINARRRGETKSPAVMRHAVRSENTETRNPKYDPRVHGAPVYRHEFAELLGEPPRGRSALDALNLSPRKGPSLPSMIDRAFGMPAD